MICVTEQKELDAPKTGDIVHNQAFTIDTLKVVVNELLVFFLNSLSCITESF